MRKQVHYLLHEKHGAYKFVAHGKMNTIDLAMKAADTTQRHKSMKPTFKGRRQPR